MAETNPIIIEKLYGGLSYDYSAFTTGFATEAPENEYTKTLGINLFHRGFYGHICPATVFNNIIVGTPIVNSSLRAALPDISTTVLANINTYFITGGLSGTAPRIVSLSGSPLTTPVTTTVIVAHAGHNFTTLPQGTGFWGEDVAFYRHKSGGTQTSSLFYSWNDSVDGDIGQLPAPFVATAGVQNFGSSVPTTGTGFLATDVAHRFVELSPSAAGILYVTNGQFIASYDGQTGANGTYNTQALDLGAGWIATDARRFKKYIAVTANKSTSPVVGTTILAAVSYQFYNQAKVVLWDGAAPGPNFVYDVDDNYVSSAFVANNDLYIFTMGRNQTTKLWKFNNVGFSLLKEFRTNNHGTAPLPNCIEFYKQQIHWTPADALSSRLLSYGPLDGRVPAGLHVPMIVYDGTGAPSSTTQATAVGMLKNIETLNLYAGATLNGAFNLVYNNDTGFFPSAQLRTRLIPVPYRSGIYKFTFLFSQFGTNASLQIAGYKDYNTAAFAGTNDLINKTLTNATLGGVFFHSFEVNIDDCNAFYLDLNLNHTAATDTACIIRAIIVEDVTSRAY